MITNIQQIAPFVQKQFPAFYNEEGENFIQFVKAYYEWMDQQGPIYKSRRIEEYTDIDTTTQDYINYFMDKFLNGIPYNILADKKLLEKHILDVYRAKGSIEGLKLLFRLLYNLDANIYLPQVDILRASDGKWIQRQFLEIIDTPINFSYNKKTVYGSTSGASAHVEDVVQINFDGRLNHILYLTNLVQGPTGQFFLKDEHVLYDGLKIQDSSKILGSVISADVLGSTENNTIGEILIPQNSIGEGVKFIVSELLDPLRARGYISFKLLDGGDGYTLNSNVNISYGTATTGTGANFKIGSIVNPVSFTYNLNYLDPVASTSLNAADYGSTLNFANINTLLAIALTDQTTTVGSIGSLKSVTSGDRNYNGSLVVNVHEPITYGYGIIGSNGGYWGDNAVITATPSTGNGVISKVNVIASGYDYEENEILNVFYQANSALNAQLQLHLGGIGKEEGYWKNDDGMLNSDKFIQDSYYYQTFSYEVQIEKSLDKYLDILKKVMHPIGNKVFGRTLFYDIDEPTFENKYEVVEIYQGGLPWNGGTIVTTI